MKRVIQRQITTIKIVSIHLTWAEEGGASETSSDSEIVSLAQHSFVHQDDSISPFPFEGGGVFLDSTSPADDPDPDRS